MFTLSNPFLLWAFPVLLLPWIFRRRQDERIQHIEFPLLRFLKESEEKELVNPKLQELLLLILRTFLLALLLLGLAGPKWISQGGGQVPFLSFLPFKSTLQSTHVVVDTSYSMGYGSGDGSWWNRSRIALERIQAEGSGFNTLYTDWNAATIAPESAGQWENLSYEQMLLRFEELPEQEGTTIAALASRLQESLTGDERIVVITDGQRYPWLGLLEPGASSTLPPLLVVTVGEAGAENAWVQVDSITSPPWGISAWESITGYVRAVNPAGGSNYALSIIHEPGGKNLFGQDTPFPSTSNEVVSVPFQFTAQEDIGSLAASGGGEGNLFRAALLVEPADLLPIDNKIEISVPVVGAFTVGITHNPAAKPQGLEFISTALNPFSASGDSVGIQIEPVFFAEDFGGETPDLVIASNYLMPDWQPANSAAALDYVKNGGNLLVFTGGGADGSPAWDQFLSETGWEWLEETGAGQVVDSFEAGESQNLASALREWSASAWKAWTPARSGRLNGSGAQPVVTYLSGQATRHLISSVKLGNGWIWLANTSIDRNSETLWSPVLPSLLWEVSKTAARLKSDYPYDLPPQRQESDLRVLSDEEKQALTGRYGVEFATIDTLSEKLAQHSGGMDLRYLILILAVFVALFESWLSNRLASL